MAQLKVQSNASLEGSKFCHTATLSEQVYSSFLILYQHLGTPNCEDAAAQDTLRLIKDGVKLNDIIPESQQDALAKDLFKRCWDNVVVRHPRGISYVQAAGIVNDFTRWREAELKVAGLAVTEATSHLLFLKLISTRELQVNSQQEVILAREAPVVNFIYSEIKPLIREWFPKYPATPDIQEISLILAEFADIPENQQRMQELGLHLTEDTPYFFKLKYETPYLFNAKLTSAPPESLLIHENLSRIHDILGSTDEGDGIALDTVTLLLKDNQISRFVYPFEQDKFASFLHDKIGKTVLSNFSNGIPHTGKSGICVQFCNGTCF